MYLHFSKVVLYQRRVSRLDELGQTFCVFGVKTGLICIMRLDERSDVMHLERRTKKDSLSRH